MSKSAGLLPIFSTFLPYFGAAAENFGTVCIISAQPPQNLGATAANSARPPQKSEPAGNQRVHIM